MAEWSASSPATTSLPPGSELPPDQGSEEAPGPAASRFSPAPRTAARFRRSRSVRASNVISGVAVLFVGSLLIGGVGGTPFSPFEPVKVSEACAPARAPVAIEPKAFLNLSIFVDPIHNREFFSPGNFSIPSKTLVEVTIANYDSGPSVVASPYRDVCGTVGDVEIIHGMAVTRISTGAVAHTFTFPSGHYAGLNVPIPPASASPAQVSFQLYFGTPGVYRWQCEAQCNETMSSVDGSMSGLVTVV